MHRLVGTIMKETIILPNSDFPEFKDKDGNLYRPSDLDPDSIIEAIDNELSEHGLEILSGDYGSSNYFFCIVKRGE